MYSSRCMQGQGCKKSVLVVQGTAEGDGGMGWFIFKGKLNVALPRTNSFLCSPVQASVL